MKALKQAELFDTPMAESWIHEGTKVLEDTILLKTPISEAGYFSASKPRARSYRFDAKAGQVLTVGGTARASGHKGKIFLDLFIMEDNVWKSIAFADSGFTLSYEFDQSRS
ncbi:MAG TPA: hypothetical protein VL947_10255, partial [Cytophagales bacterium]|nr:hypothetical protein [Cytophagales bacterium]